MEWLDTGKKFSGLIKKSACLLLPLNIVFLGSGCKIIGNVKIADNVAVGAGAVVVKDCKEENSTYAGVPAKKISSNNSDEFVFWYKYRNRGENN